MSATITVASPRRPKTLWEIVPDPKNPKKFRIKLKLHRGQKQAARSKKRFVVVLAGTQGGKTSYGPFWLWKEIKARGPGDYLVVTPTYPLLLKKALPEFLRLFKRTLRLGTFEKQQKIFVFDENGNQDTFGYQPEEMTQIFFGHATDPESLESATAKAVWCDEAGQKKFRLGSWEAILRRLSINEGRALITTTPYDLGWLKQLLWDPWNDEREAGREHPLIDIIRFDSTENPAFPAREFERARKDLPPWKFDLFYRAIFTRPAGLIYSSFDASKHTCPRFTIPDHWPRFVGLDFGGVNTAAVFFAQELTQDDFKKPTGRLIAYREYKAGERSAAQHCAELMKGEPRIPTCAGGSKSEGQWRREFAQGGTVDGKRIAGIPIHGPAKPEAQSVEVGIDRVFAAFARDQIMIFEDLHGLLDELASYSRELDEMGNPTEKIDAKDTYHILDSVRYIINHLNLDKPLGGYGKGHVAHKGPANL